MTMENMLSGVQNAASARIGPLDEARGYEVEVRAVSRAGVGRTNTLRFFVPRLRTPSDAQPTDVHGE